MKRRPHGQQALWPVALGLALLLAASACSSADPSASANRTAAPTTEFHGPPSGTLPNLVAPPRSYKPVFAGEQADVEKAFRARLDAYEQKDVNAILAITSAPGPSLRQQTLAFVSTYRIRLYRITAISVKGTKAKIDYENAIVGRNLNLNVTTVLGQHEVWTRADGSWKFVSDRSSTPGIPQDLTSVSVTMTDGAAIVVPSPPPNTDFAFLIRNRGSATKGAFILGLPNDLKVSNLFADLARVGNAREKNRSAPMPDGVREMGATNDIPAHGTGTMVFNIRLPKGRYILIGRSASTGDHVGSLLPNEYAEFTVK